MFYYDSYLLLHILFRKCGDISRDFLEFLVSLAEVVLFSLMRFVMLSRIYACDFSTLFLPNSTYKF